MEKKLKVSVCITVFNEEESITELLESLLSQTKMPDEIVVVDGGSTDNTVKILKDYAKNHKYIRIFKRKGNIAYGRNQSVTLSRFPIIAHTDAGCTAKADWLEKLTAPFKNPKTDIVAGFYLMRTENDFQKAASQYLGISPQRYNKETFLPSARCVAYKKEIWQKLGGFSEKLGSTAEDTEYFYKAVKKKYVIKRVKNAVVYWNETAKLTPESFFKKVFNYAKGDARTNIWWHPEKKLSTHNIKIIFVYARYLLFALALYLYFSFGLSEYLYASLFLIAVYYYWSVRKWRKDIKSKRGKLWVPVVQSISDLGVMSGFLYGLLTGVKR